MSQWIVITVDDLDDYLVAAQMTALKSAALGSGQTNPFTRVMPDVASRIRAEIAASGKYQVSATANSIPPDLKTIACLMIIEAMQSRLPMLELSEDQRNLLRDGRDYLKRIAEGKVPVEMPDDAITPTVQAGGGIQVVGYSAKKTGRTNLSGL